MPDKITPDFYDKRIGELAGNLEENRWKLAELVWRAKQDKIPNWAERTATNRYIKRSARTVREWAQVAELRASLPRLYDIPFTYYNRALRFLDRLPAEIIMDAMEQVEMDDSATAESFSDYLRQEAKADDETPFNLADWLSEEYERAESALGDATADADIEAVKRIMNALDSERSKVMKHKATRPVPGVAKRA